MLVELKALKSNPYRNYAVDPIDEENIKTLVQSIKQDGFWGGVICRNHNGEIQIGAGHHRIKAAIKAGIEYADLFVGEFDDSSMIRVYARENATQRGNSGTALAGSIAAAVRFVGKALLTGATPKFGSSHDLNVARQRLTDERGIGEPIITEFLDGVPGINKSTVTHQLANLKESGEYANIIKSVQEEIERENKEALQALARAEREQKEAHEQAHKAEEQCKAAALIAKAAREQQQRKDAELARQRAEVESQLAAKRKAEAEAEMKKFDALKTTRDTAEKAVNKSAEREVTFDFEGVARHLKNANQIDVFRECVTGQGVAPYLPVNKQGTLARRLVEKAKEDRCELSGAFIRTHVISLVLSATNGARQLSQEEQRKLEYEDFRRKVLRYQDDFSRSCRGMMSAGATLSDLHKRWPKQSGEFPISGEFRKDLTTAKRVIDELLTRL